MKGLENCFCIKKSPLVIFVITGFRGDVNITTLKSPKNLTMCMPSKILSSADAGWTKKVQWVTSHFEDETLKRNGRTSLSHAVQVSFILLPLKNVDPLKSKSVSQCSIYFTFFSLIKTKH